jgi:hypothetical protein
MTHKEEAILSYLLAEGGYVSPTQVGINVRGKPPQTASAWACPTLLRMAKKLWVIRSSRGHYIVTRKGQDALICNL